MPLQHDVVIVLGKRGHGKTTLVKQLLTLYSRRLIIDAHGYEYNEGIIFNSLRPLFEFLKLHRNDKKWSIIYRPQNDEEIEKIFAIAQTLQSFVLVCEEADKYIEPKHLNKNLLWLINYGRHIQCSVIMVARSVPEIAIDVRKEYTTFFCFRFTEPSYLFWLNKYGFNAEVIANLEKHEFVFLGDSILPENKIENVKKSNIPEQEQQETE